MFFKNNTRLTSPGIWLTALYTAHRRSNLSSTSPNNFGWKTRRYVQKWQNQRYQWNEAIYGQSYYTVSMETTARPIDWWQIWLSGANFDLLFRGAKSFHNGYIAHLLSESDEIWQRWGSGQSKVISQISWTLLRDPVIPCGDMHQSFTDALVKCFSTTSLCLTNF